MAADAYGLFVMESPDAFSFVSLEAVCKGQNQPFHRLCPPTIPTKRVLESPIDDSFVMIGDPPVYCGRVKDAFVFGKTYITDASRWAVFYFQSHRNYVLDDFKSAYREEIELADAPFTEIEQECVFLGAGSTPLNFGHFIFEFVSRLVIIEKCGLLNSLPMVVFDDVPETWLSFLDLYGVDRSRLIKIPRRPAVRFKSVWMTSCPNFLGVPNFQDMSVDMSYAIWREGLESLRKRMISQASVSADSGPARVFIGREGAAHRRIQNYNEVWTALQALGFEKIDFAEKPAADQIRLIGSAEIAVVAAGASSIMTAFAPKHCSIIELIAPNLLGGLGSLCAAAILGQPFTRLFVNAVEDNETADADLDVHVDVSQMKDFIRILAAGPGDIE